VKRIIRSFLIQAGILYLISTAVSGLSFADGVTGLLITAFALTLAGLFLKPIINLLLLPINLITFGLLRWLTSAVVLFVVDLVLPQFSVGILQFAGFTSELFSLPAFSSPSIVVSYILFSLIISLLTSLLYWLVK
jgi:putative membrane protein